LDLLRRRAEHAARAGIVQDVLGLLCRQRGVDRNVGRLRAEAGVIGDRPLRPRLGHDRPAIARLSPQLPQPERQGLDPLPQLAVGDRLPYPAHLRPQRGGLVTVAVDAGEEQLGERALGHWNTTTNLSGCGVLGTRLPSARNACAVTTAESGRGPAVKRT